MVAPITRRRFLYTAGTTAAVAIGGSVLAACGGTGTTGTASNPVTLTFGWWSNGPVKDKALTDWLAEFTKANPTIKIKSEILSWGDYWNKLSTTVAGGNAWDVIGMAGGMAAPYFDQDVLLDMSKFSDLSKATANLDKSAVSMCNWKGKQYSLPVGIYVLALAYNKTLLKAAGLAYPDPETPMELSDFMKYAEKLSVKKNGKYVQYAINPNYLDALWTDFINMEGGQVYDTAVNPKKMLLTDPAQTSFALKGLTDYQSLWKSNAAVPYSQMGNGSYGAGDLDCMLTNKVGFSRTVLGDFTQVVQQNLTDTVGLTPLFAINGKQVTAGNANSYGIYAGSKNSEAAWTFIKWATSAGQVGFGKTSDIPADLTAASTLSTYLQPTDWAKTLVSAKKGFVPEVMCPNAQFNTDMGNILPDLANGKITPAQALQQLQAKGQADLNAVS